MGMAFLYCTFFRILFYWEQINIIKSSCIIIKVWVCIHKSRRIICVYNILWPSKVKFWIFFWHEKTHTQYYEFVFGEFICPWWCQIWMHYHKIHVIIGRVLRLLLLLDDEHWKFNAYVCTLLLLHAAPINIQKFQKYIFIQRKNFILILKNRIV